jgi:hypothetical protein
VTQRCKMCYKSSCGCHYVRNAQRGMGGGVTVALLALQRYSSMPDEVQWSESVRETARR